jgi:hypothetical protein
MEKILPLGKIVYRNKEIDFGIKNNDRLRHIYIVGKTGGGKTTLLENLIINDIKQNNGIGFIDPHGDSVQKILNHIPKERINDVIYFNATDINHPIAFNPLEKVSWEYRHLVTSSLITIFKKIWVDAWSARMEYILTNTLLALLEWPEATLLDINRLLADEKFRQIVINNLKDDVVKAFWTQEFSKYHLQFRTEAIAPIQNKIGQFITNPLIRNIIGQTKSSFNLREIMDEGKIFLANLSIGAIGEETARLLGGLLITKFQLASMSRVDIPESERKDFFLYIDEFQNFATESFIKILSESRKYHLGLILAHQYLDQVPEEIIKAVFGNVGTFIIFRIGSNDAEIFSKEFDNLLEISHFTNLPNFYAYIKLLVDGKTTKPFLAKMPPPLQEPTESFKDEIIQLSRLKYSKNRNLVEAKIAQIYKEIKFEDQKLMYCRNCKQPFFSSGNIICDQCLNTQIKGISLKKAIESQLIIKTKSTKEETKKEEITLDKILEKLQNNES